MGDTLDTGIPNIRVIIREFTDDTLALNVPNLVVKVEKNSDYNVNIVPNYKSTLRTGSYKSYADFAFNAASASYVSPSGLPTGIVSSSSQINTGSFSGSITTASYAITASYATMLPSGVVSSSVQVVGYIDNTSITPAQVTSNEYKLVAGEVSITFTGSISTGIFGVTEYIYPFIPTSSYTATTIEYVASRPGSLRVGVILCAWAGGQIISTDVSSTDIGDTSDIRFAPIQSDGYVKLRVESLGGGSYPWTVQSLFKLFPTLV
jgi:hypothetical protein